MSQRYIGGLIYNPPGGFSGYFDGATGNFLNAPANAAFNFGTGDFTVEAWVFPASTSGTRPIVEIRTSAANSTGFALLSQSGASTLNVYTNGGFVGASTNTLATGAWNHVALVRSGNTWTYWINGVSGGSFTNSSTQSDGATTGPKIGGSTTSGEIWNGYISNVRLLKGTALYTSAFTPPVGQLQAITNTSLLTCAYPTFRDGSSNNFTITVNGNTAVSTQNPFPQTQLPNPALGNQGNGVYSMSQYQALRSQNLWPAIDPYFDFVTLMLHGNGTNGAQNNTFLDSSTNNFTITRNGNTTQGTFTPYGSNWSNYFDGSDDLNAPSNAAFTYGTSDFTIEGWFFITGRSGPNSYEYLFAQGSSTGTSSLGLYREGGVLKVWNGSTVITGTTTLALNTWNHIALSRTGTTMRLFLNGVQEGSATNSNSISTGSSYGISIGRWTEIDTNYIVGYVSNFRVVKGTAVYTSAFTPSTSPLTAITNTSLLTCQSNRFIDNSTNNFTITRNGDVSVQRFSPFNPTTPYAAGTIGGSGYFDGNGDYLSLPINSAFLLGTGDCCIEAWIYTGSTAGQMIYDTRDGSFGNPSVAFEITASQVLSFFSGNFSSASAVISGGTVPLNAWTHVAITRSSGTNSLYINGTRVATNTNAWNQSGTATSNWIGAANFSGSFRYFNGYISNLRIVKGSAVYTGATITPPAAPLSAIANTSILLNFTNGGIIDNAMMNDLETVGNAQISTSVSKFGGGSLAFDGTGDYLLVPTNQNMNFGSGNFTIEMWIYPLNVSSSPYLIDGRSTSTASENVVTLYVDSSQYVTYWVNGAARITANSTVSLNAWSHVAVVKNGGITTMYLNGTPVGTWTDGTTYIASNYLIGQRTATSSQSWNGYIDDLRITRGYARYTANFTPQRSQWQDQ